MFNYFLYILIEKDTNGFLSSNMLRLFLRFRGKMRKVGYTLQFFKRSSVRGFSNLNNLCKKVAHFTILYYLKIEVQFINIKVL